MHKPVELSDFQPDVIRRSSASQTILNVDVQNAPDSERIGNLLVGTLDVLALSVRFGVQLFVQLAKKKNTNFVRSPLKRELLLLQSSVLP